MEDVLTTYSLGSCIGVSMYDRVRQVAGLLHFQLPTSANDPNRASEKPLMYADTGMEVLLQMMVDLGAEVRRLRVGLCGGARMLNDSNLFDIGRKNHASIRKILWKKGKFIAGEHVGGELPRTMQINVADGAVTVKCDRELISFQP
jgi:chemotaxis protein CheD